MHRTKVTLGIIIFISVIFRFFILWANEKSPYYPNLAVSFATTAYCTEKGFIFKYDPIMRQNLGVAQNEQFRLIDLEEYRKLTATSDLRCVTDETYSLPGYTLLLTLFFSVFQKATYYPAQIFSALLDGVGSVILIYLLVKEKCVKSALISAGIYATMPGFVRLASVPLPDSMVSFMVLAITALTYYWLTNQKLLILLVLSAITGISSYFRPDIFFLPLLLGLVVFIDQKSIRKVILYVFTQYLVWLIFLTPLGIYNLVKTGNYEIFRPAIGINLWEGIGEYKNPCGMEANDEKARDKMLESGAQWGTKEGDRVLLHDTLSCIQENPIFLFQP